MTSVTVAIPSGLPWSLLSPLVYDFRLTWLTSQTRSVRVSLSRRALPRYRSRRTAPCCVSAVGFRPALPTPDQHVSAHPAFQFRLGVFPFSPSYSPFVSSLLLPVRFLSARNVSTPSPCVRLSRTPWVVVTPPTTTGPLPLLHHWRSVRLPRVGRCSRFRRCSHSTFSVSFRYPSAILMSSELPRKVKLHG